MLLARMPLHRAEQNTQCSKKSLASEHFQSSSAALLRIGALEGETANHSKANRGRQNQTKAQETEHSGN